MSRYLTSRIAAIILASWCSTPVASTVGQPGDSETVVAIVSIRDRSGRPVRGLTEAEFTVTQDGRPVLWRFRKPVPRDILLLFDHSGSLGGGAGIEGRYSTDDGRSVRGGVLVRRTGGVERRIARSVGEGLAAEDRARVASFGTGGRVSERYQSGEALAGALDTVRQADAPSPLWDAVYGLPELFRSTELGQPVVLILTDGLGTANVRSHAEAVARVRDSGVMVYTAASRVGLDSNDRDESALSPRTALSAVSGATGARLFETDSASSDLPEAFFRDLASTYTLSIDTVDAGTSLPQIRVERGSADVVVRWISPRPSSRR